MVCHSSVEVCNAGNTRWNSFETVVKSLKTSDYFWVTNGCGREYRSRNARLHINPLVTVPSDNLITRFIRKYCVLVIWAVSGEFRSIEEHTWLVGVLLARNQEIRVRTSPMSCFFWYLNVFYWRISLFLPPYICHLFFLETCDSSDPSPAHACNLILLEFCVLYIPLSWRSCSLLFIPFLQACQYFETSFLKWRILLY